MIEIRELLDNKKEMAKVFPDPIHLESVLAKGGQGIVYSGSASGLPAAIKIYYPGQLQTRIDREILALATLKSEHIVRVLWSGRIKVAGVELPVVATELVDGIDLGAKLKINSLTVPEVGALVYDIADAICELWDKRIVHRDLKPPNILMRSNGRACIIDLGVARHIDLTPLTTVNSTWGTPGYMSPEQAQFVRTLTCKSDVFALGVVAVECLLGRHPTGQDQNELLSKDLGENLPPGLAAWEHGHVITAMLHARHTSRPMPRDIVHALSEYAL